MEQFNPDTICSYCGDNLIIKRLQCINCGTAVEGNFKLSTFAGLSAEEQEFVFSFVLASGSLKEIASKLNLSYPTIRSKLDRIIEKLNKAIGRSKSILRSKKEKIIEMAEKKNISVEAAEEIIKNIL